MSFRAGFELATSNYALGFACGLLVDAAVLVIGVLSTISFVTALRGETQ